MALSILDGNQSATTLSTILSSGQHITAHTVVSLGTQAITDMRSAVSGSVVSVSSLPAISGTVTANLGISATSEYQDFVELIDDGTAQAAIGVHIKGQSSSSILGISSSPLVISGTVTIGSLPASTVTVSNISSLPDTDGNPVIRSFMFGYNYGDEVPVAVAIDGQSLLVSGTVTASLGGAIPAGANRIGVVTIGGGTVTIGAGTAQIGSVTASISNSLTISSLPAISGTVTANTFALQGTAVTTSNFTSTTASTVLANFNATREVLTIFNEGAGNLHICAGANCTTIAYQVRLSAGDYYEVPNHQTSITHSAVFATAGTARVTEVS
jgi:hypothetical protein